MQPTTTVLAIKVRWNIDLCDRKSSTTLVWRYGFWKSVHTRLWSWQPGCHHTNYEQNWSSLTHVSIFWLYSGVFFVFFLGEVQLSTALCDLKIAVWGQTDVFYSSSTSEIRLGRSGLDIIGGGATQQWWPKKIRPNYVQNRLEATALPPITSCARVSSSPMRCVARPGFSRL